MSFLKELRGRGYRGLVILCSSATSDTLRIEAHAFANVHVVDKAGELHLIPKLLQDNGLEAKR